MPYQLPVPKVIRFARCGSIDVDSNPSDFYALGDVEAEKLCNLVFDQGDSGLVLIQKVNLVSG